METENKNTKWEWNETEMIYTAIMPKGFRKSFDLKRIISKEKWLTLDENDRFIYRYGFKQLVSDTSNTANSEKERAEKMEAKFIRLINGDLKRASSDKITAKKIVASIDAIRLDATLTMEQKKAMALKAMGFSE